MFYKEANGGCVSGNDGNTKYVHEGVEVLIVSHKHKTICYLFASPDSAPTRVIIQHSQTVFPGNITCWLRYLADYTFQLNRAARFVKFVYGFQTSFIHNLNSWHWRREKEGKTRRRNRHKTFITFRVMQGKFIIVVAAKPFLLIEHIFENRFGSYTRQHDKQMRKLPPKKVRVELPRGSDNSDKVAGGIKCDYVFMSLTWHKELSFCGKSFPPRRGSDRWKTSKFKGTKIFEGAHKLPGITCKFRRFFRVSSW